MSWIKETDEQDADPELKRVYDRTAGKRGKLSNVMKAHSLNPEAMEGHLDLYLRTVFGQSDLSREERELIGVTVSAANGCEYCVQHHGEALNHYWKDPTRLALFIQNFKAVELPERSRAIVDYAAKLTTGARFIKEMDIECLREAGLEDRDILDINLIASYFNFVNRIALGLGVEFDRDEVKGYSY